MGTLIEINRVLLWVLAVVTTAFPIIYLALAPAWRSWLGRGVVILGVALALLADLSLLFRHWTPPPVIGQLIVMCVFLLIIVGSVTKTVAVVLLQLKGHRDDEARPTSERS